MNVLLKQTPVVTMELTELIAQRQEQIPCSAHSNEP